MSDKALNAARVKLTAAGLPAALLPDTVSEFTPDEATGRFDVRLRNKTVLEPGGHAVTYAPVLRGRITSGLLDELEGVTVKIGFFNPAITRIEGSADGKTITFVVMGTRHDVPASAFA